MTPNAGIVDAFDLRHAFSVALAGAPADDAETEDGDDSTDSDANDSTDQDTGDQDEGEDEDQADQDVKHPRLKKLSEEAARRRQEAKVQRKRAEAAEGVARDLRCEVAFLRSAAAAGITDPGAAWKLADTTGLGVDENDNVTGVDTLVNNLVDRYPYLVEVDGDDDEDYLPLVSSGVSQNRKSGPAQSSKEALYKKFPALRRAR